MWRTSRFSFKPLHAPLLQEGQDPVRELVLDGPQSIPLWLLATGIRTYMLSDPSGAILGSVRVGTWRYMLKSSGQDLLVEDVLQEPLYRSDRIRVWCSSSGYCFFVPR